MKLRNGNAQLHSDCYLLRGNVIMFVQKKKYFRLSVRLVMRYFFLKIRYFASVSLSEVRYLLRMSFLKLRHFFLKFFLLRFSLLRVRLKLSLAHLYIANYVEYFFILHQLAKALQKLSGGRDDRLSRHIKSLINSARSTPFATSLSAEVNHRPLDQ